MTLSERASVVRVPLKAIVAGTLVAGFVAAAVLAFGADADTPPERFTVRSDGHPIAVWARRPASPRGAVLLVHGRTWSGRPDFDLQVPSLERSVLASLAARGFAAYAIDLRGYGETPRDASGWNTPRRSAADIGNVLAWMGEQHPALPRPALIGWSRGGALAMMVGQTSPSRVSSVVLFGFAYDPDAKFAETPADLILVRAKNTADAAASDFISPKVTPPAVVRAFVAQALRADPVTADLRGDGEFNDLSVDKLTVPALVMYGERDPGISPDDAKKFFGRLASADKQLVVLPGADHAAHLEDTHDAWVNAVVSFITRPAVRR